MQRLAAAAAVLAAAGCYSPFAPSNVPCDPARPACPSGESCQQVGGAFVCTGAAVVPEVDASIPTEDDQDGDDVPNAIDNCPGTPNRNQADEDADLRGDACDNCPPFYNLDQLDGDGDGVGNLCDPEPTLPGDRITLFEGFHDGIPSSWNRTGTWAGVGGVASAQAAPTAPASTLHVSVPSTARQSLVTTVGVVGVSGPAAAAGLIDQATTVPTSGVACAGARTVTNEPVLGLIDGKDQLFYAAAPLSFEAGSAYQLWMYREGSYYWCEGDPFVGQTVEIEDEPLTPSARGPLLGLVVYRASATFPWIMIISSPP